jgi:hypothetical protein
MKIAAERRVEEALERYARGKKSFEFVLRVFARQIAEEGARLGLERCVALARVVLEEGDA